MAHEPTVPRPKSILVEVVIVLVGLGTLLLAFVMSTAVLVNLPDSWFGAVLVLAEAGLGGAFIWHGGRRLWLKLK